MHNKTICICCTKCEKDFLVINKYLHVWFFCFGYLPDTLKALNETQRDEKKNVTNKRDDKNKSCVLLL